MEDSASLGLIVGVMFASALLGAIAAILFERGRGH
jgi:hypothetical protein